MSGCLNFEEFGKAIATIGNKTLYLNDKPIRDGFSSYETKGDQTIQHIPDKKTERSVLYITAPSGSGKSYYTKEYIQQYKKMYPKREVFIFSSLDSDPTLDKLKYIKRMKIKSEIFLNAELSVKDFADSLCIFDDCDVISDKHIKKKVFTLLNEMLEIGRHFNVSVIFTSHTATAGNESKKILNECHSITTFAKNMGGKMSRYLYDQYLGLDKDEIKKLKTMSGRWVTVVKCYPMIMFSEKEVYVLRQT